MAHVVGVPKRDPCAKCALPVFLAERMAIGLNIYHRTCLKCARCSSQLTLGNFYETEVDGEFCCETCPDEEEKENQANRSSIADRLAFFESAQIDEKVLTKSLSDEEKSKSLKAAVVPTYKSNAAFNNFVLDEDQTDNGALGGDSVPELPSSSPPPLEPTFTSSSSIVVKSNKTSPTANHALKSISSEETKDIDSTKMNGNNEESPENVASPTIDLETTNRLSLVRARLNQFEEIESLEKEEEKAITAPINELEQVPETKSEEEDSLTEERKESKEDENMSEDEVVVVSLNLEDSPTIDEKNNVPEEKVILEESLIQDIPTLEEIDIPSENDVLSQSNVSPLPEIPIQNVPLTNEESSPIDQEITSTLPETIVLEKTSPIPEIIVNDELEIKSQENVEEVSLEEISFPNENEDKKDDENYPDYLNPFQSDEDQEERENKPEASPRAITSTPTANESQNPFDSSDDEVELDKVKSKPPRPPPPKVSKNPFGSESEEEESAMNLSSTSKTPIPKPRTSTNPTPEPTPRPSLKQSSFNTSTPLNNDVYGSTPSLNRYCDSRGSNNSLTSNTSSAIHSRKSRRAPPPPGPVIKELFPSTETLSSQNSSSSTTPKQGRKKRPAPPPPSLTVSKNLDSCPQQSQLSDEEKALLEGNANNIEKKPSGRRLIALDLRIINDQDCSDVMQKKEEENVVYRRKITPLDMISSPTDDDDYTPTTRQLEKLKDNKESQNRNRQSQLAISNEDDSFLNKSSHGKWKRRKGPAPQLPVPPRKILQMLPLQEIRHELDIIEVQQQGLEKQGVVLEKMIRERCEGRDGELEEVDGKQQQNSKEVEDLILQLFELVNEKNELFRRQAELMYLRRQHRLEQEQADLEYEIRLLMAQPERNKTDSDKSREETMIARLVEVVQLRNEVIECLEMDRLREAEEDMSIKQQLEIHSAKRENDHDSHSEKESSSQMKLSKKEKKKQKESKKLGKSKKADADKDTDESEVAKEKTDKKKKKKFLFLH
ncbi:MICALL1.2 family protein [Megaselia abdita]